MNTVELDADVLIVGGGPSGAICAYYLAQSDKKVILIDSQAFPRDKICGDFISPASLKELARTEIIDLDAFKATNIIISATISLDEKRHLTDRIPQIKELADYGRVIPRVFLDNWIINMAKQQGVNVIENCKLINYTIHETHVTADCEQFGKKIIFSSKVLVGADGSNSRVARLLQGKKPNPNHKIIAVRAYFENVNCISQQAEIFFSKKNFPGYCWFFPVTESTANVGIGVLLETLPKIETNLKTLLFDAIDSDKLFQTRIGQEATLSKIAGWPLSCYDPTAVNVKDRVLLVGDAAGLINPFSGEGIQYALQSGRLAAESIIDCFKKDCFSAASLKQFDIQLRKNIGLDLSFGNVIVHLIRNKNLSILWFNLLKVIYYRAQKDKQYASVNGGILVGSVPMYRLLSISYVYKTIVQLMVCLFRVIYKKKAAVMHAPIFLCSNISLAVKQKKAYWLWISGIFKTIFTFIQMAIKITILKMQAFFKA